MSVIKRVMLGLFLAITAMLTVVGFLVGTTAGARAVIQLTDWLAGPEITIGAKQIHGRLINRLELDRLRVASPEFNFVTSQAKLRWRPRELLHGRIVIERLAVDDGTITLHGDDKASAATHPPDITWLPDIRLDQLNVSNLQVIQGGRSTLINRFTSQATLSSGRLVLSSTRLEMPELHAEANGSADLVTLSLADLRVAWHWQTPQLLRPVAGTARLHGDLRRLDIDVKLSSPAQANASAVVEQVATAPIWHVKASTDAINLHESISTRLPDLTIAMAGKSSGSKDTINMDASGDVLFDGRSHPWQLEAILPLDSNTYPELKVVSGRSSIRVEPGSNIVNSALLTLDIPELGELWPGLAGTLSGNGALTGPRSKPQVDLSLTGEELGFMEYRLRHIELHSAFDTEISADKPVQMTARFNQAGINKHTVDGQLHIDGTMDNASLDMNLSADGQGSLQARIEGGLEGDVMHAVIKQLSLDHSLTGAWHNKKEANLTLGQKNGGLSELCLVQAEARICTDLTWKNKRIDARVEFESLPLAMVSRFTQSDVYQLDGRLAGHVDTSIGDGRILALDMSANATEGHLIHTEGDQVETLPIPRLNASIEHGKEQLQVAIQASDAYDDKLDVTLGLSDALMDLGRSDLPLSGRIKVAMPTLQLVTFFVEDAGLPSGTLDADVEIAGTMDSPDLHGTASLDIPSFILTEPSIEFSELALKVDMTGKHLQASGAGKVDGQPMTVEGQAELLSASDWHASLQLAGNAIRLENLYGSSLQLSPDINVSVEQGMVELYGSINLEGSDIFIRDVSSTVRPSADVRIVDEQAGPASAWHVTSDFQLILTGENRLRVAGFDGLLGGQVKVHKEYGRLATGEGALTVERGIYRAYGASVPIRSGRLEFIGGALDDPAIQIESRRKINQREVGFDVSGTLQSPVVTLVSNPHMDQSEILSLLLYGEDGASQAGTTAAILAGTIRQALGREEEESFLQRWLARTGLTGVGVEADANGVGLSKQISPRLFLKYKVDVWDNAERHLLLRYLLNDHWVLEGTSGSEGSADIIYERER